MAQYSVTADKAKNDGSGLPSEIVTHTLTYVLITPAKNEALCIEKTILSVLAQDRKPKEWVIVDDASSDDTAEIVNHYVQEHSWITLVRLLKRETRSFASKVDAFDAGLEVLRNKEYDLLGNLDADILLKPNYYSNVLSEFAKDPGLGISGGVIYFPVGTKYITQDTSWDSVGGAVQLFRRECFRQIGGYMRLEGGGIDAAAEIMARMHGWTVRKLANNCVHEQRRTGLASGRPWKAAYKEGVQYHRLGYNTLFYSVRCAYRVSDRPLLLAGLLGLTGFLSAKVLRVPVRLPSEVVAYLHSEQKRKLWRHLLAKATVFRAH